MARSEKILPARKKIVCSGGLRAPLYLALIDFGHMLLYAQRSRCFSQRSSFVDISSLILSHTIHLHLFANYFSWYKFFVPYYCSIMMCPFRISLSTLIIDIDANNRLAQPTTHLNDPHHTAKSIARTLCSYARLPRKNFTQPVQKAEAD